jgi:GNAT superfamily N-acetyltransferase
MTEITFRDAVAADVPAIIAMLREDDLGAARETASSDHYASAFNTLLTQSQTTMVVGARGPDIIAYYQLTTIDGLSHRAARRGNIEDVRVAQHLRGQGIGHLMMEDAVTRARALGCGMLQLVAHTSRQATHKFYLSVGFTASHMGFKRAL